MSASATRVNGISDFDALHSGQHDELVQLYAFNILALDGEDLRGRASDCRKEKFCTGSWMRIPA